MNNADKYKKTFILFLVGGGIFFYLHAVLLIVHLCIVKEDMPNISFAEAMARAMQRMAEGPFTEIFPPAKGTFQMIFFFTTFIFIFVGLIYSYSASRNHAKLDVLYGDAHFLSGKELEQYTQDKTFPFNKPGHDDVRNIIMSKEFFLGMDNEVSQRNMNVLLIGGSGAGKTFTYVGPNLMQMHSSYVITDPSGAVFKKYGAMLEYYGYKVKCFNLDKMDKGCHYNPFAYIHSDKEIASLVNTLIQNTTPPDASKGDPFWEKSETALLNAIIAYLYHYAEPNQQTFTNVIKTILTANIDEADNSVENPLDQLFNEVRERDPASYAVSQYDTFRMGAGKTLKSILISCAVRLNAFFLDAVVSLTSRDDIDLTSVGDEYTALFIIIPTNDPTFNFLAAMMYSQLFQILYEYSENTAEFSVMLTDSDGRVIKTFRAKTLQDKELAKKRAASLLEKLKAGAQIRENHEMGWFEIYTEDGEFVGYRGSQKEAEKALKKIQAGKIMENSSQSNNGQRLPIHVRMILDEFANTGKIPKFPETVATIRKYEISANIILQSISQLQEMYDKEWESLSGNCDNLVYLGGGLDETTQEWISKACGKTTKKQKSDSFNSGGNGGGSQSYSYVQADLITPDQVRTLPEKECIVVAKSLPPYKGPKFITPDHKMYSFVKTLPPYNFNPEKLRYLDEKKSEGARIMSFEAQHEMEKKKGVAQEQNVVEINQAREQRGQEYANNMDINGVNVMSGVKDLHTGDDESIDESPTDTEKMLGMTGRTPEEAAEDVFETTDYWYNAIYAQEYEFGSEAAAG